MHVIFIFQGVVKIINDGVPTLEANANDFQKATNKDQRKKHVFIEESKNLAKMKLEGIQASSEAHDMRLKQRNSKREKVAEQELQARFIKKSGKEKEKQGKNLANDYKSSKNSKNYSDLIKKGMDNKYFGKKVDMKEVQCHNCQGFCHYARDYRRKKVVRAKDNDEAQYAHAADSDSDDVLLMPNTQSSNEKINMWYQDLGCSKHMAGNKTWFTKLDESVKKVIKFVDGRHITSDGKGNIYGYNIKLEKKQMNVYDGDEILILKAPLGDNKALQKIYGIHLF
ncbi:uncharacterized protein LOC127122160 [Lathyrus oleraceus]|uniref:uncharacterized protein LOC127122160 n=1 Tax=Pisum sativum TaxID=3888 RepID=UPI0021D3B53D|nr:uncharacterized protein LOC127122160 [Pisum sativum]